MTARLLVVAAVGSALLAGCAADPRGDLRLLVEDITAEANARDADGVRAGVEELLAEVEAAERAGELPAGEAAALRASAVALRDGVDEIDPDVLARREAERSAREAQQQLEAERAAAADAERQRQEEERRRAEEQAARDAEEAAKRAEEEAERAEEEREEADQGEGEGDR